MKEKLLTIKNTAASFWTERTKGQKGIFIGSAALGIALLAVILFLSADSKFAPLYNDLSLQEVSQILSETVGPPSPPPPAVHIWLYAAGAALLVIIIY